MTPRQKILKRAFDLTGAAIGLVLLSPVLLVLMLGVKLTSPGPALYRQTRVGRDGSFFSMLKVRTMHYSPEDEGSHITTAGDDRITTYGKLLRRYKLDELPQVWNVLKGDMSFVGPRPDVPGYADQLRGDERRVLDIRPGITGPSSLYFRDEEELLAEVDEPVEHNDRVLYPIKTRLNLEYLDSWSFSRDLGYLLVTIVPSCNRWLRLLPEREPPSGRKGR
jgi:lipopolysaccharide/colanic/teichoic acid biosynthesis glycosyltransferase